MSVMSNAKFRPTARFSRKRILSPNLLLFLAKESQRKLIGMPEIPP
jgi:hypothetical protein